MATPTPHILRVTEHKRLGEARLLSDNSDTPPWSKDEADRLLKYLRAHLSDAPRDDQEPDSTHASDIANLRYLGMTDRGEMGYYIGVDWLCDPATPGSESASIPSPSLNADSSSVPDSPGASAIPEIARNPAGVALLVTPKIKDIDWLGMFMHCLKCPRISTHMRGCYSISARRPAIPLKKDDTLDITPLLLLHYLAVLERIVRSGLKRGYVIRQENLSSKIKGKLLLGKTITKNRCHGRDDRNYCRYQDYTVDCMENRILKRALDYARRWFGAHPRWSGGANSLAVSAQAGRCQAALAEVGSDVDIRRIERMRINPLYRDYVEGLILARAILRHFHYSFREVTDHSDDRRQIPPFRINMPMLFELYAYAKLEEKYPGKIEYQLHEKYGYVDFLKKDERMIIDTKYKNTYIENKKEYDIQDIRQLAGYARDVGVREKLGIPKPTKESDADAESAFPMPYCLILYPPDPSGEDHQRGLPEKLAHLTDLANSENKKWQISHFTRFYKYPLAVPIRKG